MIDFAKKVDFHVGDKVTVDSLSGARGSIETIRIISDARTVEEYHGAPNRVVLTIQLKSGLVNKRGAEISPIPDRL